MTSACADRRFVVDHMLGKMAKWLRVMGFDVRYERLVRADQVERYGQEGFIIISRNQRWAGLSNVLFPSSNDPMEQLREVVAGVPILPEEICLLHRCILCNGHLKPLSRDEAFGRVPDYVFETNTHFYECPGCQKVYWPGSHPRRIAERLGLLLGWHL
jgi:uncharacterized protein